MTEQAIQEKGYAHPEALVTTEWVAEHLRSEEHTSELQSRQYLVCRLLLEKKKQEELSSFVVFKQLHAHWIRVNRPPAMGPPVIGHAQIAATSYHMAVVWQRRLLNCVDTN